MYCLMASHVLHPPSPAFCHVLSLDLLVLGFFPAPGPCFLLSTLFSCLMGCYSIHSRVFIVSAFIIDCGTCLALACFAGCWLKTIGLIKIPDFAQRPVYLRLHDGLDGNDL